MKAFLMSLFLIGSIFSAEFKYPYLSDHAWRAFANWHLTESEGFDPLNVQKGDTIRVDGNQLKRFEEEYLPRIHQPFILITLEKKLRSKYESLLASDKLAAWFLQNPADLSDKKIFPIPLGLGPINEGEKDQLYLIHWIRASLSKKRENPNLNLAFLDNANYSAKIRFPSFVATNQRRQRYDQHLHDLSESLFVIISREDGLDCHEIWEALLLGCFPVIKRSSPNPLYEGLPVVVVEEWDQVTSEFLKAQYEELKSKSETRDPFYAPYWFQKVRDVQKGILR